MIDRGKKSVLGVDISVIDYDAAVSQIMAAANEKRAFGVSALAVHGVMTGATDPTHKFRLNALDIVAPDGQPVRWALRWLHREKLPDRVYGPTLTLKVCEAAEKERLSIYLYGSRQIVLEKLVEALSRKFPALKIAGSEPSKFRHLTENEVDELAIRIKSSGASIVFVGLGCPRQEVFAFENLKRIGLPLLAVGAAFDFHAGILAQAPRWMQNMGLEWLFRLTVEPRRLWKRYLLLNPYFCGLFILQFLGLSKTLFERKKAPKESEKFG
ncbi:WecB/TagA/CpsF family glycosyltransferase [Rhodobacterales bacterium LSUCC0031]|nr:WecB/TagA/CpsF family glycosyltransferase [Rhodobacterales bacterium LSUCC0031]